MILEELTIKMIKYYEGDPKRIQHFMKVRGFAKMIAHVEQLNEEEQLIIETAAIVHDIAIRLCEEKYGDCNGKLQEKEGPALAKNMLEELGFERYVIERVSFLVGHHHTYNNIQGIDYQILVEADFLVNLFEDGISDIHVKNAYEKIFKTKTGKEICKTMFDI